MVVALDIETSGLNPYEREIILVGLKKKGKIKQWKLWETKNEGQLILSVFEEIELISETIVGFNTLKFDVPFMLERLRILGKWEPRFFEITRKNWLDLYQYLGNDFRSLSHWLKKAGIRRDRPELHGRDIPTLYRNGEFDKIEAHNTDDLNTCEQLFLFLKKTNPELLPFA